MNPAGDDHRPIMAGERLPMHALDNRHRFATTERELEALASSVASTGERARRIWFGAENAQWAASDDGSGVGNSESAGPLAPRAARRRGPAPTPLSFFYCSALAFRDKTAVVYGEQRYTYGEFATRVNRFASALRGAGLEEGDRVAILCPNIPPTLESHFAVPLAGGVLVAINTRLAADDVAWILEHCGARFLLVDTELSPLVAPVRDQLPGLRHIINIVDTGPAPTLPGPAMRSSWLGDNRITKSGDWRVRTR